jgi:hypothetical protein
MWLLHVLTAWDLKFQVCLGYTSTPAALKRTSVTAFHDMMFDKFWKAFLSCQLRPLLVGFRVKKYVANGMKESAVNFIKLFSVVNKSVKK